MIVSNISIDMVMNTYTDHRLQIMLKSWMYSSSPQHQQPVPSNDIWVRSRNCGCLVSWFCYQLYRDLTHIENAFPSSYSFGYTHACLRQKGSAKPWALCTLFENTHKMLYHDTTIHRVQIKRCSGSSAYHGFEFPDAPGDDAFNPR